MAECIRQYTWEEFISELDRRYGGHVGKADRMFMGLDEFTVLSKTMFTYKVIRYGPESWVVEPDFEAYELVDKCIKNKDAHDEDYRARFKVKVLCEGYPNERSYIDPLPLSSIFKLSEPILILIDREEEPVEYR